jgi:hypothetical protein
MEMKFGESVISLQRDKPPQLRSLVMGYSCGNDMSVAAVKIPESKWRDVSVSLGNCTLAAPNRNQQQ